MNRTEVEHNLKVGMYAKKFQELDSLLDYLNAMVCNKTTTAVTFHYHNGGELQLYLKPQDFINLIKGKRAELLQVYNEFINGRI